MYKKIFLAFIFAPLALFAGNKELDERIQAFTRIYRSQEGRLHLLPLTDEAKQHLLQSPSCLKESEKTLDKKFQERLKEALSAESSLTGFEALKIYLDYAASKTPCWRDGDREAFVLLEALDDNTLRLDPKIFNPQQTADIIYGDFVYRWGKDYSKFGLGNPIFFPVVTTRLFNPVLLVKYAIQNVFLVDVPPENMCVHGLELSSLGQVVHDIAHGLAITSFKEKLFRKDFQSLFEKDLGSMSYDDNETFVKKTSKREEKPSDTFEGLGHAGKPDS